MAISAPQRNFSMTYADLIYVCNSKHVFMERDHTDFEAFGITSALIAEFESKVDDFENLPDDSELEVIVKDATLEKNNFKEVLINNARSMEQRARMAFGVNVPKYTLFYLKDLANATDNNLLVFSRAMQRSAELYKLALEPFGLTQAMIDQFILDNQNFENAMDAQVHAIGARDMATVNRVNKANELYTLLTQYCDAGKNLYANSDPAKYNDYLIYSGSTNNLPSKVLHFHYDIDRFEWDVNAKAELYELQYKQLNGGTGEWTTMSIITQTYYGYQKQIGRYEYRVRATNGDGAGDWSDVLEFNIPVPPAVSNLVATHYLPTPTTPNNVRLIWTVPEGIGSFQIYRAAVNGTYNNPVPTTYNQVDTVSGGDWEDVTFLPLGKNMLYYYVLNLDTNGDPLPNSQSNVAFVDLNAPV